MVHIDMSAPVASATPDGWYLMKVTEVIEAVSRSGDAMLKIKLNGIHDRNVQTSDVIMLGGRGWGIGRAKLTALGVPESFAGEFDLDGFLDRPVWVALKAESYLGRDGKTYTGIKPDASQGMYYGYQPEATPPVGVEVSEVGDDTPF